MWLTLPMHLLALLWIFALGSVVGSFVNVCIYRIPWQKSVIWPGSHCPKCLSAIAARDNIPILSWRLLRGRCRHCRAPISARYLMIELLVALLFCAVYLTDVVFSSPSMFGEEAYARAGYHALLISFLVAATFMDFDLVVIPDGVTVTGMVLALLVGTLVPEVRFDPSSAVPAAVASHWRGLWIGVQGLLVGGGLIWSVRLLAGVVFRREAMGFGDVTLLAMIGAFLGWQAAVLTFFLAPFPALAQVLWKLLRSLGKRLRGEQLLESDREIPYGPYLSMTAAALVLGWPWIWWGWGQKAFAGVYAVGRFLVTGQP
jgi:leader peptidase (prepilin peptidase)/N-methyltransferase